MGFDTSFLPPSFTSLPVDLSSDRRHSKVSVVLIAQVHGHCCVPGMPLRWVFFSPRSRWETERGFGPGLRVPELVRVRGRIQTRARESGFMHSILAKRYLCFKNYTAKEVCDSPLF